MLFAQISFSASIPEVPIRAVFSPSIQDGEAPRLPSCPLPELSKAKDKEFKNDTFKEIIEYKWLLEYDLSPKVKKVKKINKLLGIKNTVKILGFYLNHRRKKS